MRGLTAIGWLAATSAAMLLILGSCAPTPLALPRPAAPVAAPAPRPLPPQQGNRAPSAWDERALDSGQWRYDPATRTATFIQPGNPPLASLRCSADRGTVILSAGLGMGDRPQRAVLFTSFGRDELAMTNDAIAFPASDPRLERMAFSRGRFALDAANGSTLTLPAQAEIGRIVEDCRG